LHLQPLDVELLVGEEDQFLPALGLLVDLLKLLDVGGEEIEEF
jgi:hypothetical protein